MLLPVTRFWPRTSGGVSRRLSAGCLALALALGAGESLAATLHQSYRFDVSRLESVKRGPYDVLRVADLTHTWEAGQPEIPFDVVNVLVPQGSRLVGLRARALGEHVLAENVVLAPAAPMVNDAGAELLPRAPRLTVQAVQAGPGTLRAAAPGRAAYPAVLAEAAGGGTLHGYQMVSVRVFPVRWEAQTRRLLACERLDLELDLEPGGARPLGRERWRPDLEAQARRALAARVANPEALDGYSRRLGLRVEKPAGGFQPTDAPSLEGSDVDYVIVTTDALAATYQVLADWKTRRGVPTVVRTVEWIEAHYRHGSDVQETIRTFIRDAYAKWGVQYVTLAGDTDILPARYGYSAFGEETERHIPTDMYFACLDGNWNLDGDALWGEGAISGLDPGDSTDFYAEVYVGRIPFSTPSKASTFVTKLLAYENPVQTTYQNKLLLLGEVLFPVDWDPGDPVSMDGAQFCEEMAAYATPCVSITRLYENYTDFPGSQPLTLAAGIAAMNTGQGIVNHIGHGFRYNMSLGDLSFQNHHALALTNTTRRFVLYMLNCTATAFDFPCLAEAFLESPGGAVAVLGASRAAYALPSRNYNRGFFEAVYQDSVTHVGQAFVESRLVQTPNAWFESGDHYTHLLYNFLGDPETVLHTCTLGTTSASYVASIGLGTTNVNVHVEAGGAPRQGALVCLQKGTEEYEFGTTDAGGDVTLAFRAETSGSVQVTVSGQNMTTHLGSISVTTGSQAYVRTTSLTVDDNGTGASSGNSDGVLDAGETLELSVGFSNSGSVSTGAVTGVLRIPVGGVTVVDSTYSFSSLGAGGSTVSTNQVYFAVPAGMADGTVLPLTFVSTNGTSTWTDVVNKEVHAPRMELTLLDVDDFAPGGNGDGVIQANETFDLLVYWKNYGTGAADGLTGTLSSGDPDVTIFAAAVSAGRADPLEEVTGATRFRLKETVLAENALVLTLTDSESRTLVSNLTLRGPSQPAAPLLDASTGANIVVVTWPPSADADLAGYHVYRALSGAGPWTRLTADRTVRVAYFRSTGLAPATRYWYRVTAVDASGNESPHSSTASINTSPAQLAGWPITLGASSSCPVVVGDVTGDGSQEIVAGNDHLYAWAHDGDELRDDDGNAQTWGVFANEVQTVTGAVALAHVDAAPGFEIFVTTWEDSNEVYVVRGDGSIAPGWPRRPDLAANPKGYWASAAAMDVDGDGLAELFAAAKNGNLYAWHGDGSPLGATDAFKGGLGTWGRVSPSFANLDSDPQPEIVFGAPNGTLQVWNHDGTNKAPFPKTVGSACYGNTAIGDVNDDGTLDIVMITEGGNVNVYDSQTGNQLAGWPRHVSMRATPIQPSPALADFDFDGKLDIVVANNDSTVSQSRVRVLDWQGNLRPGWPRPTGGVSSESSPIVADFSGDGVPDILFGNESGQLFGWDASGADLAGFPLTVGDFIRSTPYAADVDGDGGIDLVLSGWDKNLYVWDFPVPYVEAAAQWPTLKHDSQRTANFDHHPGQTTDVGPDPVAARLPARPELAQNVPNPFNPLTSIAYGVPAQGGAATLEVELDVFDVRGRLVRRLVRGRQAPGTHRALWDGRDEQGGRVRSGVYLYRLRAGGSTLSRKMLLVQ
jgi:hypothetical protein